MVKTTSIFSLKRQVKGKWVAVMNFSRNDRGIKLSSFRTRCFQKNEIHEFILCDINTDLSSIINDVYYLGFGEFHEGGVVEVGDVMYLGNKMLGTILGFDETHFPNHYNILVNCANPKIGSKLGISPEEDFIIKQDISK